MVSELCFSLGLNVLSLPVADFRPQETKKLINLDMCVLGNLTCKSQDELDAEEEI